MLGEIKKEVKRMTAAGAGSALTVIATGLVLKGSVPALMAKTGVVVSGVGTLFEAGGTVATVQSTSALALSGPVLASAAGIGVGAYATYRVGEVVYRKAITARKNDDVIRLTPKTEADGGCCARRLLSPIRTVLATISPLHASKL